MMEDDDVNNNNKRGIGSPTPSTEDPSYSTPDLNRSTYARVPTTKPPGILVSVLLTIAIFPLILFIVLVSVPINLAISLWHVISSPFVRQRLERLKKKNWNTNNKTSLDASSPIVIVGAGIGGLTIAHFLIKCGYTNVRVFEKYKDCGLDRGGGHGLIAGSWCFRSMGMSDVYQETVNPATEWKFDSGRPWLSAALKFWWMHSNPFLPALSYELGCFLRSDFLKYLSETLPAGVLHLEHELTEIEEQGDGEIIRVSFANGKEYSGRLIIGCDGSNSKVRKLMMQKRMKNDNEEFVAASTASHSASDPFYVDINVWWCVTKLSDIPIMERTKWDTGPSRLYFEGGAIMQIVANDSLILSIDYRAPTLRRDHKNWSANSTGADLLEFMRDWKIPSKYWPAAKYASRVALFAIPKGLGSEEATLWHYSTNVVLLGDAVHPTPHFFGQGANAAIQDAYCLVRCLHTIPSNNDGSLSDAFSEYVKVRKPPADDIISKSYLLGLTETTGGIARLARDLIFFTVLKTGLFVWAAVDINSVRV